jgi:glycosyltransferase involved in cell wall biosynthesis
MMPAVAIEAALVGTPVLATRVGAMAELVELGVRAVLVERPSVNDLVGNLDPALSLKGPRAGLSTLDPSLTMAATVQDWSRLIRRIVVCHG